MLPLGLDHILSYHRILLILKPVTLWSLNLIHDLQFKYYIDFRILAADLPSCITFYSMCNYHMPLLIFVNNLVLYDCIIICVCHILWLIFTIIITGRPRNLITLPTICRLANICIFTEAFASHQILSLRLLRADEKKFS